YFDYATGVYTRNIYGNANPDVPKELGDVGNDLQIYGSKLYAVINCSNKIEVMDAATTRRIGQVNIPNVRYIRFEGPYAYATSYAGPVQIDENYKQLGYVAKIDTASLQVVDTCLVGFQPDQLEILNGKIYVANSGGYMVPRYEKTVSVIDMASFKVVENIPIAINLHHIKADKRGCLWITSRGDYYDTEAALFCYDTRKGRMEKKLDVPVSAMDMVGDSLYIVSAQWSYLTMSNTPAYCIVNTLTKEKVCDNFITDGSESEIKIPYLVKVNPLTHDIFVSDARNYVNPGYLHCYSPEGVRRWKVRTGDIPSQIVFTGKVK
ncbi:MAG: hypothetical protein NC548_63045, partial [Lachnospiraceae bacterium]|nr:hypothetical protein [Lachnospiraceae bacterium]